jgi:hypothetical protein
MDEDKGMKGRKGRKLVERSCRKGRRGGLTAVQKASQPFS